jgi:hypothetical protein
MVCTGYRLQATGRQIAGDQVPIVEHDTVK